MRVPSLFIYFFVLILLCVVDAPDSKHIHICKFNFFFIDFKSPAAMRHLFQSDTLYWSDTNGNTIKSSDFNGNFVKKIYGVYRRSQRVHGVTLFDGQIYWTDRYVNSMRLFIAYALLKERIVD